MQGIYIIHGPNGRVYVGQAVNIARRLKQHRHQLAVGKHNNSFLQASVKKHGISSFLFLPMLLVTRHDDLTAEEQRVMDLFEDKYNLAPAAGSMFGFKQSKESRQKIGDSNKKRTVSTDTRAKISASQKGSKRTALASENISKALTGRKLSESHRLSLSKALTGKDCSASHPDARARTTAALMGRKVSEDTCALIAKSNQGQKRSDETKQRLSESHLGNRPSEETKRRMSASQAIVQNDPDHRLRQSQKMKEVWAARKIAHDHMSKIPAHNQPQLADLFGIYQEI